MEKTYKAGDLFYLLDNGSGLSHVIIKILEINNDRFMAQYLDTKQTYPYSIRFFKKNKMIKLNGKLARLFYL